MTIKIPTYFTRNNFKICGIYFLLAGEEIIYIGQSHDLFRRVFESDLPCRRAGYTTIRIIQCEDEKRLHYEKRWILKFRPRLNSKHLEQWTSHGPEPGWKKVPVHLIKRGQRGRALIQRSKYTPKKKV